MKKASQLEKLLEVLGMSLPDFAQTIGYTRQNVDVAIKEAEIRSKMVRSIFKAYPQVNPVWLMTGVGEVLKGDDEDIRVRTEAFQIQALKQEKQALENTVKQLQAELTEVKRVKGLLVESLSHLTELREQNKKATPEDGP